MFENPYKGAYEFKPYVTDMQPVEGASARKSLYLKAGDRISVNDLLYALLLRSANDAAAALAILSSGSIEAFAEEMNKTARMLSLENTHFDNPHGLDSETHYSSARDLALIMEYAMQNETFAKITASSKHTVTFPDRAQVLYNHNKLLFLRDDVIGGKTTCEQCRFLVPTSDLLNQTLGKWGPEICFNKSSR